MSSIQPTSPDEKVNWDRDEPPKPLDAARVQALVSLWLPNARVTGAQLMKGGLMNRNFRLTLDTEPHVCVLRLFDRDGAICAKETAILDMLRGTVPVPEVYYRNLNGLGAEPPFAILSIMEGFSLRSVRATGDAEAVAAICYDAGRVLARIAEHRFDRPGMLTASLDVDDTFDGPLTCAGLVERFMGSRFFQQRFSVAERIRLLQFVTDREPEAAEFLAPTSLVHGDFNSPNVFGAQVAGRWSVSAVLDWEFAVAASTYCDIGNFVRYHRADRPRYAPDLERGLRDAGMDLPSHWLTIARIADLPALIELLGRERIPDLVVRELRDLVLSL